MAAALACSKILKELAKEEEDTDTTDDMLALAEEYEHKAIGEREGTSTPELLLHPRAALAPQRAGELYSEDVWGVINEGPILTVMAMMLQGPCLHGGGSAGSTTVWCNVLILLRRVTLWVPGPGAQPCLPGTGLSRCVHRLLPQG